uniref:PID domain-containing protein n=1 Tax=Lutzomyia longipalpis TaxID=7200 RepID=A0A1B0ESS0_LUTLO
MLLFEENQSQQSIGSSTMTSNANHEDRDEVDFVVRSSYGSTEKKSPDLISHTNGGLPHLIKEITSKDSGGEKKKKAQEKIPIKSPLERLPIFRSHMKKATTECAQKEVRPKLCKNGTSIAARLLGNTYNTATATAKKRSSLKRSTPVSRTTNTERFHKCVDIGGFEEAQYQSIEGHHDRDISARALRSLTKGLGKLLRRRTDSVNISTPDPEYKVSYLGNVLTGWAKGEGCVEKPMSTLWRNYVQHYKPEVVMRIKVSSSGLKATTKQHGLTEYWSHRITHCAAPENFPKVFCWIYRHEGRKLKHELRCHAVLCSKESIARDISVTLQNNLFKALKEFRQDKISRQNARLSLANSVYDNPTIPRRKMLLSVGGNNYKPPLERSKSAPKLMAIEEDVGEEEGAANETETTDTRACCREDSLYPAMTLGKRKCRRGHSIRRTGRRGVSFKMPIMEENNNDCTEEELYGQMDTKNSFKTSTNGGGSDEDFDSLLGNEPLIGELMSLFEMKLRPPPKTLSLSDLLDADDADRPATPVKMNRSLDALDKYSDSEDEGTCFNQNDILAMLRKESVRCSSPDSQTNELYGALRQRSGSALRLNESLRSHKLTPVAAGESDEPQHPGKKVALESPPAMLRLSTGLVHLDSDEGSISSGCETASTVTANTDEMNAKNTSVEDDVVLLEPVGEKNSLEELPQAYRRSVTFPPDLKSLDPIDSDSEFSDESGFSDFQENSHKTRSKAIVA